MSAISGAARRSAAIRSTVSDTIALSGRNVRHVRRAPGKLIGITLNPLVMMIVVGYLFKNAIVSPTRGSYQEYIMAGIAAQVGLASIGPTAIGVAMDLRGGLIDRFKSLPISGRPCWSGILFRISWWQSSHWVSSPLRGMSWAGVPTTASCGSRRVRATARLHLCHVVGRRVAWPSGQEDLEGDSIGRGARARLIHVPVHRVPECPGNAGMGAPGRGMESAQLGRECLSPSVGKPGRHRG